MTLLHPIEPATAIADVAHEHAWQTRSSHRVSSGVVRYVECVTCGSRRIDEQRHRDEPPTPVSRVIPAAIS